MAETVVHASAAKHLNRIWNGLDESPRAIPDAMREHIEAILSSRAVAFKYISITGLLAKRTNRNVHPRALQVGSSLQGAYDARSLCHKVVVPFENGIGNLWGLSNEPFLSKAARHPEHDRANPQLKQKVLAGHLHEVLEHARTASPTAVEALLAAALRFSRTLSAATTTAEERCETNYLNVLSFATKLLTAGDGGAGLVAVVGAFLALLNPDCEVQIHRSHASDRFSGIAGDIELFANDRLMSAYECKQRPLTLEDVRHGLRKASTGAVAEYGFAIAAGFAPGQEAGIREEIAKGAESRDVFLLELADLLPTWTAALNPTRRAVFGQTVEQILREDMKLADRANESSRLWNELGSTTPASGEEQ